MDQEERTADTAGAGWPRSSTVHLAVVAGVCTAFRAVLWISGSRFRDDPYTIRHSLQLLDPRELAADPFLAFTNNHIQPPMWNFVVGVVLRWSPLSSTPSFHLLFFAAGIGTVCLLWWLLWDLGSPRWVATVASIVVGLSPIMISSEQVLMYESLVTLLVTLSVWTCARYLRGPTIGRFVAFAVVLVVATWTRATLNPLWVVLALGFVLLVRRSRVRWRAHLAVGAVAVAVMMAPFLHNWVRFGTLGTSSYLGMNWEHATVLQLPASDLRRLVDEGRVSPAALVVPFAQYSEYAPLFPPCLPHTGKAVLDRFEKPNGEPNMNNICYLEPDKQARRDAWAVVRADPAKYLTTVGRSTMMFSSWGVQHSLMRRGFLPDWVTIYDPLVLPVHIDHDWGFGEPQEPFITVSDRFFGRQSFSITVAIALLGSFVLAGRGVWRWVRQRATHPDLVRIFIGGTVFAVMVPSVLFDTFESARYREPLDPILLGPLFALVIGAVARGVGRIRARSSTPGTPEQAGADG